MVLPEEAVEVADVAAAEAEGEHAAAEGSRAGQVPP